MQHVSKNENIKCIIYCKIEKGIRVPNIAVKFVDKCKYLQKTVNRWRVCVK